MLLLPPLEGSYLLLKDINIAILAVAFCKGYGIAHARSKNDKYGKTRKVWIACDKQGKYAPLANERDTGTRKTDCQMSFTIQRDHSTRLWHITVVNAEHNHPPSRDPRVHPCHRKLAIADKELIKRLSKDMQPLQIIGQLQDQGAKVILQDIYNVKKALKKEKLARRTPMHALLDKLKGSRDFFIEY